MLVDELFGGCDGDFVGCWEFVIFESSLVELGVFFFWVGYGNYYKG